LWFMASESFLLKPSQPDIVFITQTFLMH